MKPTFRLNGKPCEFKREDPAVKRILAGAQKLKDGDVFHSQEFAAMLGMGRLRNESHPDLAPYRVKVGRSVVWGNRKTIEMLRKHLEAA